MTLRLFNGNRLERLSGALAESLRDPLPSPLEEECLVVQSDGMSRWVSMELARLLGVAANLRFFYPNGFVDFIHRRVFEEALTPACLDRETLTWRILALLPALSREEAFRPIRHYIEGDGDPLKRLQLADQIADTLDQYMLYRPDWIIRWEKGGDDHWQAALWRSLVDVCGPDHRAGRARALLECLQKRAAPVDRLPRRVSVFGSSTLPPFHLELLAALGEFTDVKLFLLNPCREYWGGILSDAEMGRVAAKAGGSVPEEDLHLEKGNSLLASLGTLGRDFFDRIFQYDVVDIPLHEDPGEETLLHCLQADMLHLREREGKEKKTLASKDRSLSIHSVHGPMREMEVLRDILIDGFEGDPALRPGDILVMTPDIEKYTPYIQVVFGRPGASPVIPFTIADRTLGKESRLADHFFALLDLPGTRFTVTRVLALLESPLVQRRFELTPGDVERISGWILETRIAWGMDEQDKLSRGLPPFRENTWRAGLDRLLLGYAMTGQENGLFEGILPCDSVEGRETAILGKWLVFMEALADTSARLEEPRPLAAWGRFLEDLLARFFLPREEEERDFRAITDVFHRLAGLEEASRYSEPFDLRALRWFLSRVLEARGFGYGFLTGAVTFCAMVPMRSLPFKVVCLAGLDGDAFPRETHPPGFDLMARHPRPGDRSRRTDDRYLFLEALLSARNRLVITYGGQDLRDNTKRPPSVVVSELVDYIEENFAAPEGEILSTVVTEHRLQGFNPAYFNKAERLFSYSEESFRAASRLLEEKSPPDPFFAGKIPEPEPEWRTVSLENLARFWTHPVRYLLTRRLGIRLDEREMSPSDREPMDLEKGLPRYLLESGLARYRSGGGDPARLYPVVRASGVLPHGTPGEWTFDRSWRSVDAFFRVLEDHRGGESPKFLDVDLSLGGFRLTGRVEGLYREQALRYRVGRIRAVDRLSAWLNHLALCAGEGASRLGKTLLAGRKVEKRKEETVFCLYRPVPDPLPLLEELLSLYWEGLQGPLPFFPETSGAWAEALFRKERSSGDAREAARKAWEPNGYGFPGEGEDPYLDLCFRGNLPLGEPFSFLAEKIFKPLMFFEEAGTL